MEKTKKSGKKVNMKLLAQAIRVYEDRSHPGLSKAKTRGEVTMSTRKIYKQKGTGGARHGAKSAPIFVGGGVAHGPTGLKKILELPRKMAKGALMEAFKIKENTGMLFIENKIADVKKTKEAKALIDKLLGSKSWKTKVLVILDGEKLLAGRAFRNIENVKVVSVRALNVYEVYKVGAVAIDLGAASALELMGQKKEAKKEVKKVVAKTKKVVKAVKTEKVKKTSVVKKVAKIVKVKK
jgi:large subunit ribosomal protein L4